MKIPYFCCIGAELKRYEKDFDFMNQVYLYKIPADDTIEEVLAQDYFQAIADTVLQDDLLYIYEPTAQVLHTCRFNKQAGHITAVQLANNVPGLTPNRVLISDSAGHITAGDVTLEYLKNKVNLDGTSVMTGPLKFRAGSFSGAIAGGLGDGISIYKLRADNTIDSEVASLTKTNGFTPGTTNTQNIGSPTLKWKDAHVARVITGIINNGYDIAVPVTNSADTLALKSEVDNAANSGRMITDEGVWFAKMYAASVVPTGAEYDGKNYADFSQTDSGGNPVIKIYTGASGAWTLTDTITPPATYDGYVPVTKKIWDILDQTGQQGGRILWNHQSKTFTPFPNMVSFEDAALTGTPTAPTPTNASPDNQIATKEYVDNANPSGTYHPGLFAHEWDDHLRNDVQWLRADTFSWQDGGVYEAAYQELLSEYSDATATDEIDYLLSAPNFTRKGGVLLNDGVASNFSSTNFLSLNDSFNPQGAWEIVFKVNTGSIASTYNGLLHPTSSNFKAPVIELANGVLNVYLSGNGTSWNIASPMNGGTLASNTDYWIKLEFTGSAYNLYVSTDGTYTTPVATVSTTTTIVSIERFIVGANFTKANPWGGTIDLKQSYIKVGNEYWWKPYDTVNYKRTPKGYKIADISQADYVSVVYNKTGVAWYYILDSVNERFKLPRGKHNRYAATLGVVGNGMVLGLTNGTSNAGLYCATNTTDVQIGKNMYGQNIGYAASGTNITELGAFGVTPDATKSGIIAQQEQDTDEYKYLYFYMGQFTQTAIENTAGINTELFNDKAGIDLDNLSATGKATGASLAMPSGTYDNLTLGASGSSYTAPANGWFTLTKNASAGQFVCIESLANGCRSFSQTSIAEYPAATIPVKKGDTVVCYYNASGAVLYFRFIYAQGEQNV